VLAPPTSVALLIVPNSFWRNWKRRGSAGTPSRSAKNRISLTNSTEGSRSIVSVSTVGVDVNRPEAGALVEVFDRHGLRWARVIGSDELQPHRLAAAIAFKAAREGQIEAPAVLERIFDNPSARPDFLPAGRVLGPARIDQRAENAVNFAERGDGYEVARPALEEPRQVLLGLGKRRAIVLREDRVFRVLQCRPQSSFPLLEGPFFVSGVRRWLRSRCSGSRYWVGPLRGGGQAAGASGLTSRRASHAAKFSRETNTRSPIRVKTGPLPVLISL